MEKINNISVRSVTVPLTRPYKLSFATIEALESFVVEVTTNIGNTGFGEVVPLDGYFKEKARDVLANVTKICEELNLLSVSQAFKFTRSQIQQSPLACSAVLTALEMLDCKYIPRTLEVPLVGILSTSGKNPMGDLEAAVKAGFKTVKVKIGKDLDEDIRNSKLILEKVPSHIKIRFDANQAYDVQAASSFLKALSIFRSQIEYLEQPLDIDAWSDFEILSQSSSDIPLMLDESITTESDIERAAQIGIAFIKLKLFKHGGITELCSLATKAHELGLRVVMGNGVSTDIGNLAEAWAYEKCRHCFEEVTEANGFMKCIQPLTGCPPSVVNGNLSWVKPSDLRLKNNL